MRQQYAVLESWLSPVVTRGADFTRASWAVKEKLLVDFAMADENSRERAFLPGNTVEKRSSAGKKFFAPHADRVQKLFDGSGGNACFVNDS